MTFDPRIARDIGLAGRSRLTLIFEAFNLFNDDILSTVETGRYTVAGTVLTPNVAFGTPLTSVGERVIQLAIKLSF